MSDCLQPHELKHSMLLCPLLSRGVWSNSCLLSRWGHLTISCFAALFSVCLQPFPESGSSPKSQLFASGDRSIRASASVLPMNIQGWFPLGLTGLILSQSKVLPSVFPSITIWKHQFSVLTITEIAGPSPGVSDSICYRLGSEKMCISTKFPRDAGDAGLGIILGEPWVYTMYFSMKFCVMLNCLLFFFTFKSIRFEHQLCAGAFATWCYGYQLYFKGIIFMCNFFYHISR